MVTLDVTSWLTPPIDYDRRTYTIWLMGNEMLVYQPRIPTWTEAERLWNPGEDWLLTEPWWPRQGYPNLTLRVDSTWSLIFRVNLTWPFDLDGWFNMSCAIWWLFDLEGGLDQMDMTLACWLSNVLLNNDKYPFGKVRGQKSEVMVTAESVHSCCPSNWPLTLNGSFISPEPSSHVHYICRYTLYKVPPVCYPHPPHPPFTPVTPSHPEHGGQVWVENWACTAWLRHLLPSLDHRDPIRPQPRVLTHSSLDHRDPIRPQPRCRSVVASKEIFQSRVTYSDVCCLNQAALRGVFGGGLGPVVWRVMAGVGAGGDGDPWPEPGPGPGRGSRVTPGRGWYVPGRPVIPAITGWCVNAQGQLDESIWSRQQGWVGVGCGGGDNLTPLSFSNLVTWGGGGGHPWQAKGRGQGWVSLH